MQADLTQRRGGRREDEGRQYEMARRLPDGVMIGNRRENVAIAHQIKGNALLEGNAGCCEGATMKRVGIQIVALLVLLGTSNAQADWMFRRAYLPQGDHDPTPEMPMRPKKAAYREAETQRGPGFSVRGAYRLNVYRLQFGNTQDTTYMQEFRHEESGQ